MDISLGIAQASMDMAAARVTTEMQVAVLKNVMDAQKDVIALLLESLGVGRNLNLKG